ncbi:phage tail protein [Streptomyces flaveus]|uniref:phage tail protein n=1 Tax=Streptomyces flaveus TaxID=66370 RepID=UPI0033197288
MTTPDRTTLHALLAGDGTWPDCRLDGLEIRTDGRIELLRVPGVVPPSLSEPEPDPAEPSGLALDAHCGLYLSDAAAHRLIRIALDCGDRLELTAHPALGTPAGLCIGPQGQLFVADPQRGQIAVLSPELSPRALWREGLRRPIAVAPDGELGIFVLDTEPWQLLHLGPGGEPDTAFARSIKAPAEPRCIAAADGTLYVGDAATRSVLRFDRTGTPSSPPLAEGTAPGALAISRDRLYVADRTRGEILIVSLEDGRSLSAVAGFRGPVSALAAAPDGALHIKAGSDDHHLIAHPAAGRPAHGTLHAGPFDAGEEGSWSRAALTAEVPDGTDLFLETALTEAPDAAPPWTPAAAHDVLLDGGRYLWLRVSLTRTAQAPATASPTLHDVRAESSADDYLDHLPQVYSQQPGSDFLRRFLGLAKSALGDREDTIGLLPRDFDATTATAELLPVLAQWLAFEIPQGLRPDALRALLAEVPELHRTRGTPQGVAKAVELHTGVRPLLLEDFRARGIWVLDGPSPLGTDTVLPALSPDGTVPGAWSVGAGAPEEDGVRGQFLFADTAHRFTAVVAGHRLDECGRRRVSEVLDAEKPAHTAAHLCFVTARFRVGVQARTGVDTIVAGSAPEGLALTP